MNDSASEDSIGQYFEQQPAAISAPVEITVHLDDVEFRLLTDTGVFSRGRLDRGTAALLRYSPRPTTNGNLIDLGCGAGPIAMTLALRSPEATIWACDVNDRALDLCRTNARRLGLGNVRVVRPEEIDASVRFVQLWSNPPIRIGKQQLHALLARWLERLDGDGWLVVQRHLGADSLQRWLVDSGRPTSRWSSHGGYRILHIEER